MTTAAASLLVVVIYISLKFKLALIEFNQMNKAFQSKLIIIELLN